MTGTDFFDEDLQNREAARARGMPREESAPDLRRPVSDLNLTRLARHREDVESQVANSAQELDRLRMRQEELERERRELETLRKKQEDYERGSKEILNRLTQSLASMEKEQLKAERMVDLLQETRRSFKAMQAEIEGITEDAWPDEAVADELGNALVLIDESRMQFNKALARIDAVVAEDQPGGTPRPWLPGVPGSDSPALPGFRYWLKAGLAVSLPLVLVIVAAVIGCLAWLSRTP